MRLHLRRKGGDSTSVASAPPLITGYLVRDERRSRLHFSEELLFLLVWIIWGCGRGWARTVRCTVSSECSQLDSACVGDGKA